MLTLSLSKIKFPFTPINQAITVSLYIKEYYASDADYLLIDTNVPVDINGNITASPLPSVSVDPAQKYILKALNELCGEIYTQALIINPYCSAGYTLSIDESSCYKEVFTDPTPPSGTPDTLVAKTFASYSTCGAYIYDPGYNVNGTGTSSQISLSNAFWRNGAGLCADATTTDGPLNRNGVWASSTQNDQDIGFGVCVDVTEEKTYYIGMGCDNYGIVKLDGSEIIHQDPAALGIQYGMDAQVTFKIWHIYPVVISAGSHILELIGHNDSGVAAMGMEIYNNTPAEIAAATTYGTGAGQLNAIFRSFDYIGQNVQIGTQNAGYTCPDGYSLQTCASPLMCRRLITTPVLY